RRPPLRAREAGEDAQGERVPAPLVRAALGGGAPGLPEADRGHHVSGALAGRALALGPLRPAGPSRRPRLSGRARDRRVLLPPAPPRVPPGGRGREVPAALRARRRPASAGVRRCAIRRE